MRLGKKERFWCTTWQHCQKTAHCLGAICGGVSVALLDFSFKINLFTVVVCQFLIFMNIHARLENCSLFPKRVFVILSVRVFRWNFLCCH